MVAQISKNQRIWKVVRTPDDLPLPLIAWTMKITNIGEQLHNPHIYQQRIKRWSWTVLREMQPPIDPLNQPGS
jgi:hypothetical protein